ncbi:threonine aldolase family protein [Engelhardtia mirabilis]|uniref:L-allo-threonine aldolase n=1 Tax=Engelhardtia mirabilis TaxID=2528011 RepID=A0A518BJW1_9BACT|nr:L-allo-threonine aldolase [Planctomycetes bacterium Pla133]QDV01595.1 L-allo-threonine aldolase [Planctomycetes bacterium Pla86]
MAAELSDFRSDTVTRPSDAMRAAMAKAEVGDDVLDGDPTVRRLEEAGAQFLGKAHALFVPSGTMANQIAVGVWTRPGDEVILESEAHILRWEAGGLGANHGVQAVTPIGDDHGSLARTAVEALIRPDFVHCPRTGLLCLEQTHMGTGGRVQPLEALEGAALGARDKGVRVHLDGARLANAVVASGISAARWAQTFDSVSICLSKGLGAPVGSLVAGDEDFIEGARWQRKRLGGWMRQAGIIAAAGLMALEQNVERLAEDHALAAQLAAGFDAIDGLSSPVSEVETNIVLVRVDHPELSAVEVADRFGSHGVRVMALGAGTLRFVTHMDLASADVERAIRAAQSIFG